MSTVFAAGRQALPLSGEAAASLLRLSAAGATTYNHGPYGNLGGSGLIVTVDATAGANTPSVVFTIQGYDPVSGKWYDLLASAAVTGVSTTTLMVHPALTAAANSRASALLPDQWRVSAVHAAGATKSLTYSVGATITP